MTGQMPQRDAMTDVEVGMPVVDRVGEQVGAVADVKMGDPQAVTVRGQRMASAVHLTGPRAQLSQER